jgi:hypothetical protein
VRTALPGQKSAIDGGAEGLRKSCEKFLMCNAGNQCCIRVTQARLLAIENIVARLFADISR